jgi:hypothetical protein
LQLRSSEGTIRAYQPAYTSWFHERSWSSWFHGTSSDWVREELISRLGKNRLSEWNPSLRTFEAEREWLLFWFEPMVRIDSTGSVEEPSEREEPSDHEEPSQRT